MMSYNFVQHKFVWARLLEGRGWIRYSLLVITKFSLVRYDLHLNPKTDSQVLPLGAIAYDAMSSLPVAQCVGNIPGFRAKPSGAGGGGAHGHEGQIAATVSWPWPLLPLVLSPT